MAEGGRLGLSCWPVGGRILLIPTAETVRTCLLTQTLVLVSVSGGEGGAPNLKVKPGNRIAETSASIGEVEILLFLVSGCVIWVHSPNLSEPVYSRGGALWS